MVVCDNTGMPTLEEIEAQLTGPGGPFEVVQEPVLGEVMPVFKDRHPNLRAILQESVGHGDKEYIVLDDLRISFAEHARIVASVAKALRERFGVEKGDRVAILAANCPEWVFSFWAAISLGAIPVGLNGWWAGDEILYGVSDADPRVLIGDRKRLARIEPSDLDVPVVEIESEFEKLWHHDLEAPLPDTPIDEDDPATILYTSGTTGRPKGAINTHRNIVSLFRMQVFHGVRSMLQAAGQGGTQRLRRDELRAGQHAALPRLGALRGGGDPAGRRREDGLDGRALRSREDHAADRARAGHELGAHGHDDLPGREPPGRGELRSLEPAQRGLGRRPHQP